MRVSLCNEVIAELPFGRQCELAAALGYDGLEPAPFTWSDDPTRLTVAQIADLVGMPAPDVRRILRTTPNTDENPAGGAAAAEQQ